MYSRDYLALPFGNDTLLITCDSIGAIGPKELDEVNAEALVVGRFLARVALMELISIGAVLEAISCTFSVEPVLSEQILEGVFSETSLVHPSPRSIAAVSTEKNIPVRQTGAGITCIGRAKNNMLRNRLAVAGDIVACLGIPKSGKSVSLSDPENADLPKLLRLLSIEGVKDIIPAGSRGILYECNTLAQASNLQLSLDITDKDFLNKSAGPATSLVFACTPAAFDFIQKELYPIQFIGDLNLKEKY